MATEAEQIIEQFKNERVDIYHPSKAIIFEDAFDECTIDGEIDWDEFHAYIKDEGITRAEFELWWDAQKKHADALADLGAEYLDRNYEGWRDSVNPDHLHMEDGYQCVLGQMFGDYGNGIRVIYNEHYNDEDGPNTGDAADGEWPKANGFLSNGACYQALDLAWNRVLHDG